MHNLGETRSRNRHDHLLQTPDTFVQATLPGMNKATAVVHAAPAIGADFTQYTALLEAGGNLGAAFGSRFLFVLEGAITLRIGDEEHKLNPRGYAVIPESQPHSVIADQAARVVVIEKKFVALADTSSPRLVVGNEATVGSTALNGDADLQVRAMVPEDAGYDFAVNTMSYQPGAALSMVEVHVMEHGLLMLEGGGIYRLSESWYPVRAGDFIWMAPYCPQWFGAIGKRPAKYLIYKDWNRHPLQSEVR